MKNLGWKRKLAATLVSLGLLSPAALAQCTLNTNLVVNGDFENVDNSVTLGGYNAVLVLDWTAPTGNGYAYSHDGSLNSTGGIIPDYANGGPLAGGASFYFTPNANSPDNTVANPIQQTVDVSSGDCGSLISSGNAFYSLSAFFSSYAQQGDFGTVEIEFLDGGGGVIGSASITDADTTTWTQSFNTAPIPTATQAVQISVYGTPLSGGPDGYIDNIDLQVTDVLMLNELDIEVNRDNGSMVLSNRTGSALNFSGYSITSGIEGVNPSNSTWLSIAENYDADGDSTVDPLHIWSELSDPAAFTDLSEADLDSGLGTTLAADQSITLSTGGAWIKNPSEDLVFQYVSDLNVVTGVVTFVGNGGSPFDVGDFNTDGVVNSLDWMILRDNQHNPDLSNLRELAAYLLGDLNGDLQNNHTDFVLFVDLFNQLNGPGSFDEMLANLPEPEGALLVMTAGLSLLGVRRRQPPA